MAASVATLARSLTAGPGLGSGDVPVPSCLNQCRNSELFHCKICSEPFTNIHRLISHGSAAHSSQAGVRCPYCGQTFASAVALSLHLLVAPTLDLDKGYHGGHTSSKGGRSGEVLVAADPDTEAVTCPRCGAQLTAASRDLATHVLLECEARGPHVARAVARLVTSPDLPADLEPGLLLRMEMESVLRQQPALAAAADSKHSSLLPDQFTETCLSLPLISPDTDTADILAMFDVWSDYVNTSAGTEDIREMVNRFDDELREMKTAEAMAEGSEDEAEDEEGWDQLGVEAELARMSPCPRDIEATLAHLGLAV